MEKKEGPIWVALLAVAIVIGAILLIRPSRSAGVLSDKFNFTPKIGAELPLNVELTNEKGEKKAFGEYLKAGRPVMLLPIFFKCNGVCYAELESLTKMLVKESTVSTKKTADSVVPGRDFDLVVVSVHPKETYELGNAKKAEILSIFRMGFEKLTPEQQEELNKTLESGMHFTVGNPEEVKRLTAAMGFSYTYDEKRDWVNHPAAAAYVSTGGKVVGYNTGSNFATKIVRASVAAAAKGEPEPKGDVVLLGCYKMVAASKSTQIVVSIVNYSAVFTVLAIAFAIYRWNKKYPSDTLSTGGPTI